MQVSTDRKRKSQVCGTLYGHGDIGRYDENLIYRRLFTLQSKMMIDFVNCTALEISN